MRMFHPVAWQPVHQLYRHPSIRLLKSIDRPNPRGCRLVFNKCCPVSLKSNKTHIITHQLQCSKCSCRFNMHFARTVRYSAPLTGARKSSYWTRESCVPLCLQLSGELRTEVAASVHLQRHDLQEYQVGDALFLGFTRSIRFPTHLP